MAETIKWDTIIALSSAPVYMGQVAYPITRSVYSGVRDEWSEVGSQLCFMQGSTTPSYLSNLDETLDAYIVSNPKKQGSLDAFISAAQTSDGNLLCYISQDNHLEALDCYIQVDDILSGELSQLCFIVGNPSETDTHQAFLRGKESAEDSVMAYIKANGIGKEVLGCFVTTDTSEKEKYHLAYVSGLIQVTDSKDCFMIGHVVSDNTLLAFVLSHDVGVESQPLFVEGT